jgi:hypothetical protein
MEEGTGIEPETFQSEMFSKHSPKPFSITFLKKFGGFPEN